VTSRQETGSLDLEYARGRETNRALRYRLLRRTREVMGAIEDFAAGPVERILDLGTAEGRMLALVSEAYPDAFCAGVEFNGDLVRFGRTLFPELNLVQGDVQTLGFKEGIFDVAIATAIIEHVPDPEGVVREIRRVLKPGGILVMTAPDPFWERLATGVGHLKEDQHHRVMDLKELQELVKREGFSVLKAEKFMLSPVGMPFEFAVERCLRKLHLGCLMANQLVVARC